MRHVRGIGLAVALAAAVYFAAGWGYWRLLRQFVADHGTSPLPAAVDLPARGGGLLRDTGVIYPFAALALTALLAGLLIAAPRISPLAAGLPGLVLLAWTGLYAFSASRGVSYIPLRVDAFGAGFAALGETGLLGAAGLALVVPLFIPSRWRLRPRYRGRSRLAASAQEPSAGLSLLTEDWAGTAPTAPYPEMTRDAYRA
jgi:hypothetical protein